MRLTDLLNTPSTIDFEGLTLHLRQPRLEEIAKFTAWLEQNAREAAGRAEDLPASVHAALYAAVTRDIATKYYHWGGDASIAALSTPAGLAKLLSIIFAGDGHQLDVTTCERLVMLKMKEIAAHLTTAEEDDPKVVRAVYGLLNLPVPPLNTGPSGSAAPPTTDPPSKSDGSPSANSEGSLPGTGGTSTASPT
jgi:hypothetical protein